MAHKITKRDRQEGLKQAWHKLTFIKDVITLDDCFLSQWDVQHRKLQLDGEDTDFNILTATDDNKVIGKPFAETYKPVTNKMFLDLVRSATSTIPGCVIESVGSVINRGRVFVSVSIKDKSNWTIGNRDFQDYLNFGNGHDQSSALWVTNTNICTVCDNTFTMNLYSESKINSRIQHRGNVELKIDDVKELIDDYLGTQAMFKEEFEKLMKKPLQVTDAQNLFAGWMTRNAADGDKLLSSRGLYKVNRMTELFQSGAGNSGRNFADAFSAVTDFYTHESTRGGGTNRAEQYVSSEFGTGRAAKTSFWDVVTDIDETNKMMSAGKITLQFSN